MKHIIKETIKWGVAAALSFFIIDIAIMGFFKSSGFIKRNTNATDAIWYPNSVMIYGHEGYGVNKIDENGYVNESTNLAERYVLVMGSSQTEGLHVKSDEKYTSIMNGLLKRDDRVSVYNIARSGRKYNNIVAGFGAALEEFPNTEIVIIEVGKTDITSESLERSLSERQFSGEDTGLGLVKKLSFIEKSKIFAERNLPLAYLIYDIQLKNVISVGDESKEAIETAEYEKNLDKTMKVLKNRFDGPIIVCYLPKVEIESTGTLKLLYEDTTAIFKECCESNDIIFVDPGDAFLDAYNRASIVPYGFWNTSMGSGHLNADGNEILAEELLDIINEL